jgi:hypothetical protein
VVVGLIAGAGLPALFAVGLLVLNMSGNRTRTAGPDSDTVVGGSVPGMIAAGLCFLVVLSAIGWGIVAIYQAGHPHAK